MTMFDDDRLRETFIHDGSGGSAHENVDRTAHLEHALKKALEKNRRQRIAYKQLQRAYLCRSKEVEILSLRLK